VGEGELQLASLVVFRGLSSYTFLPTSLSLRQRKVGRRVVNEGRDRKRRKR
jgi:hypothetical protein